MACKRDLLHGISCVKAVLVGPSGSYDFKDPDYLCLPYTIAQLVQEDLADTCREARDAGTQTKWKLNKNEGE
jgi:hypothetical protein